VSYSLGTAAAVSGDSVNVAVHGEFPNAIVIVVGNQELSRCRRCGNALRIIHFGARGWTVVSAEAGSSVAGNEVDGPIHGELADHLAILVRESYGFTVSGDYKVNRDIEFRTEGGAAIATAALGAVPGDGIYVPVTFGDFADPPIVGVGSEQIA